MNVADLSQSVADATGMNGADAKKAITAVFCRQRRRCGARRGSVDLQLWQIRRQGPPRTSRPQSIDGRNDPDRRLQEGRVHYGQGTQGEGLTSAAGTQPVLRPFSPFKRLAPKAHSWLSGLAKRRSAVPSRDRIVAVGLLTQRDLEKLGPSFTNAFPVDETPCFGELLRRIDEADRALWRERDQVADVTT